MRKTDFEPRIIAFCCNWRAYVGADMAGTSRLQYPPNIRIIRVMCCGRIDPTLVLSAFAWGADGVMILGCHPGDCHYLKGNFMAEKRMQFLRQALQHMGIEKERLRLDWISASEGHKFAYLANEMVGKLKELGPIKPKLEETVDAFRTERLRWVMGLTHMEPKISRKQYYAKTREIMKDEIERQMIIGAIKQKGPLTIREISDAINVPPDKILRHMIALRKAGVISEAGEEQDGYLYAVS